MNSLAHVMKADIAMSEVGGPSTIPDLLDQITKSLDIFMGNGANDGEPFYQSVLGAISAFSAMP